MPLNRGLGFLLLTAVALTQAPPYALLAAGSPDADTREVNGYVLTEQALANYTLATRNLRVLAKRLSANCDDNDDAPKSIDATAARLNAVPEAKAALGSAGMTAHEYIVFSLSLFQSGMASWALSQPGGKLPPGVSKANVDFYRAHEAAIKTLGKPVGACDGENASGESESED